MNWIWYSPNFFALSLRFLLWPFSLLYLLIVTVRRLFYTYGIKKKCVLPVPVIVVGNLTVGGTGKTPLVIFLAQTLLQQGYHPGIISRGYKSTLDNYPHVVLAESDPLLVGDEPVLIATHTQCPVVISPKRVEAANYLLNNFYCNVIISDDGLQHYALGRDIEIVVVDASRRFSNNLCLPAGPFRESHRHIATADFVVCNGATITELSQEYNMILEPEQFVNICDTNKKQNASYFLDHSLHALAGIGNPARFFATLQQLGLNPVEHVFPDHHVFSAEEINFPLTTTVLMTEKDAIKCKNIALNNCWYLPVKAVVEEDFIEQVIEKLQTRRDVLLPDEIY